jgi:tetratricopeptide (TPR) repeat protein
MRLTEPARSLAAALGSALFLVATGARAGDPAAGEGGASPPVYDQAAAAAEEPTAEPSEDELRQRIQEEALRAAEETRRAQRRSEAPLVNDAARAALIEAHRPSPVPPDPDAWLPVPPTVQAALWARWASVLEHLPDDEAARDAYARAIGLGRDEAALWRGLGRTRLRTGDPEGAEAAFLTAFERAPGSAVVYRELGELYLLLGQADVASVALERALELAPAEPRVAGLLARARFEADPADAPAPERFWTAWPDPAQSERRLHLEASLRAFLADLPAPVRVRIEPLERAVAVPRGRRLGLAAAGALALLLLLLRAPRGRGDLAVSIEYPEELRGTFSVRVSPRPLGRKRARADRQLVLKGGVSTPTEHHLVNRETQFRRLRPRTWHVSLEGLVQDPDSEEVLAEAWEERDAVVRNGETARLAFDLHPRACPVDVKVLWDKRPAREAAVAERGRPQSLRFARAGALRLSLAKGSHTLLVGGGDRVAEVALAIDSFKPTLVEIDLAETRDVIFKGCPPAVEPYLHGDLNAAARALEREGQSGTAHRLLARLHREQGHLDRAAEHFESAGKLTEAAELRAELSDFLRAGELYDRAGEPGRAAGMFRRAGDPARAGAAFERAGDLPNAIACYREAGDISGWISALEHSGAVFEAARIALEQEDRARGIRLLQQVTSADAQFQEACTLLTDAYEREGHRDLAAGKLEEYLRQAPQGGDPDLRSRLALLHEETGNVERALEVLEALRRDEPTYPSIATRVEELRKKVSERMLTDSAAQRTTSPLPARTAPTAWLDENRYELLEEIGRGGMGVVFRARDTRLDRVVALKRLPENLRDHPKAIQLFLREAQASARLSHPNIVTVYDADQADGTFFITMELLKGRPLHQILRKKKRFTARDVAFLGRQVAAGLHYAHENGVVHRDIKTANLFFTTDRTVKIMDFGLAKMMQEVRKGATVIGGTPFYMAPEQALGESVDQRADIYAFGVTLFELATGRVPFPDGDVTYHHRHTPPPDPRSVAPDVPDALAELILEMLRKQATERCASAAEVGTRLEPLLRTEPVRS